MYQAFFYDRLNRVTSALTDTKYASNAMSYSYDSIGNMTYKSDIGSYTYSQANPHQVIRAGNKKFTYDLNGNMINNNGTKIEYNSFNKASKIIASDDSVEFSYDTNKQRYKKDTNNYTSYYLGKTYEQTIHTDGTKEDKYFIYAGNKVISIYTNKRQLGVLDPSTKYLHYDSLNSVDTITNNLGVVEARMAYKPFGEKLNLDKDGKTTQKAPHTNRGYTGHEHIEETNLIHMNARLYDPTIARFLSADTIIQDMYDTQAFNRYTYVRNNPLKYTDPSGHSWVSKAWGKYGNVITVVVFAVAVTIATGGVATAALGTFWGSTILAGAIGGAIGGATGAIIGTRLGGGTFNEAFKNGLKGAAAGAIMGGISGGFGDTWNFGRVWVTGMGGGASSEIMGGEFSDGFKVAFITAAAAYVYSSVSTEYNTNNGKAHMLQDGPSDVGRQLESWELQAIKDGTMKTPLSSDQSWFMKAVGKYLPYGDAFGEFHDGWLTYLTDFDVTPWNELSMIPSYPITVAAGMNEYTTQIIMHDSMRKEY